MTGSERSTALPAVDGRPGVVSAASSSAAAVSAVADVPIVASGAASTRTVGRALDLLAAVCLDGALTLAECARRTRLPASTALRLLRTLESSGFLFRSADGTFRAGTRMIQLGAVALGRQSLVVQAQLPLTRIVARTGESTYLVTRGAADTAVYLAMVEGTHAIRHTSWVGRAIALADLAVGRALAGDVPPYGYVAQRDRLEPDVTAIAAPVRWFGGVIAAINLLGPTYRIDEPTMHTYGGIVAREADEMSRQLGAEGRPELPELGDLGALSELIDGAR